MTNDGWNEQVDRKPPAPARRTAPLEFVRWRGTRTTFRVNACERKHLYANPDHGLLYASTLFEDSAGNCRLHYTDMQDTRQTRTFSGRGYAEGALYALVCAGFACE